MKQPKTLLFCTSFSDSNKKWSERYRKWIEYYNYKINLNFEQCLIVDDCSPIVPECDDIEIFNKQKNVDIQPSAKIVLAKFETHLGRNGMLDYPGWFRGFKFAANYAKKFGFEKVIHVESDAYLLSSKIINFVNDQRVGWSCFWCSDYNFPESAIQIIGTDQIDNYLKFVNRNYSFYKDKTIESVIPFTNIYKQFVGGRYGEKHSSLPSNVDFCCQFLDNWLI